MASHRYIVIAATDDTYAPLTLDCVRSLRRLETKLEFDIGIVDLGLSGVAKAALEAYDVTFKTVSVDIEYPARQEFERQLPYYPAMSSRPFMRDYFPNYDAYLFIDPDAWFQNPQALETIFPAVEHDNAVYIAAEFDRDYKPYFLSSKPWHLHLQWFMANYPADMVHKIFPRPMLNCGMRAFSARSPVWDRWAIMLRESLQRFTTMGRENYMIEQLSLNMVLYLEGLPFKIMPSEFNWMTLYCLPMWDWSTLSYVRPTVPRTPISVLHLTHQKKMQPIEIETTDGAKLTRSLTFSAYEDFIKERVQRQVQQL